MIHLLEPPLVRSRSTEIVFEIIPACAIAESLEYECLKVHRGHTLPHGLGAQVKRSAHVRLMTQRLHADLRNVLAWDCPAVCPTSLIIASDDEFAHPARLIDEPSRVYDRVIEPARDQVPLSLALPQEDVAAYLCAVLGSSLSERIEHVLWVRSAHRTEEDNVHGSTRRRCHRVRSVDLRLLSEPVDILRIALGGGKREKKQMAVIDGQGWRVRDSGANGACAETPSQMRLRRRLRCKWGLCADSGSNGERLSDTHTFWVPKSPLP